MRMSKVWALVGSALMAGAMVPLSGFGQTVSAAAGPGPTLTVVGYGIVNMTPASTNAGPQQLQISIQESGNTASAVLISLSRDVTKVRAQLEKASVRASSISTQGPPNLNIDNHGGGFEANETLVVNFSSMIQLGNALTASNVSDDTFVQNTFSNALNPSAPTATAAELAAGYQAAFANGAQTAQMMAQADNLQLGQSVSLVESGASYSGCGGMGGCYATPAGNPPQVGPNQELVTVTETYDTNS